MLHRLIITYQNREIVCEFEGTPLLSQVIAQSGLPFHMPCNQNHTCGKCKVKIFDAQPPCAEELRFLSADEVSQGIRLACFTHLAGDLHIALEDTAKRAKIQLSGYMPPFVLDPASHALHRPYGFAVDIGTTTVAAYLYHLTDGTLLATAAEHNRQASFGADVISRIEYCNNHTVAPLAAAIRGQLCDLFSRCAVQGRLSLEEVGAAVLTGNTTMLHLLCAIEPHDIAVAPFTPPSLFGEWVDATVLELNLPGDCPVYLPRCPNAYVGADITCAVLASGMEPDTRALLVDVGTNGEMVMAGGGAFRGCSTAAGPAFEGAGLYQGMSAVPGAINTVDTHNGDIVYTTIGDEPPKGICGSGIIDATAAVKALGALDETGHLEIADALDTGYPLGDSGVVITQGDIRQIQLAKSAVAAGIDTLLYECSIDAEQLDHFYLAGGFGSYIRMQSAVAIGLFPAPLADRVTVLGNAAGSGAALMLLSRAMLERSEWVAQRIEDISLSQSPYFMDAYIERMMF